MRFRFVSFTGRHDSFTVNERNAVNESERIRKTATSGYEKVQNKVEGRVALTGFVLYCASS
jgi:hypothetical protein